MIDTDTRVVNKNKNLIQIISNIIASTVEYAKRDKYEEGYYLLGVSEDDIESYANDIDYVSKHFMYGPFLLPKFIYMRNLQCGDKALHDQIFLDDDGVIVRICNHQDELRLNQLVQLSRMICESETVDMVKEKIDNAMASNDNKKLTRELNINLLINSGTFVFMTLLFATFLFKGVLPDKALFMVRAFISGIGCIYNCACCVYIDERKLSRAANTWVFFMMMIAMGIVSMRV